MVNANELTFGVEIETSMPRGVVSVGGYHQGTQVPELPAGWNAQRDGSIRSGCGHQGCEIVSPVLKGADGLRQVLVVLGWLQSVGARVNRSTGLHVHVGWEGDAEALDRLAHVVSNNEKALYASTGTKSRETGTYCRPIQGSQEYQEVFVNKVVRSIYNRYHGLNLTNLQTKRTVEFRVFAGSLNASKVIGYIRLCLGLVEKALATQRAATWIPKVIAESSPLHRSGEGQTALTKLFYRLGWTRGQEKRVYGDVSAEGVPTIGQTKKVLMKLARKYDRG